MSAQESELWESEPGEPGESGDSDSFSSAQSETSSFRSQSSALEAALEALAPALAEHRYFDVAAAVAASAEREELAEVPAVKRVLERVAQVEQVRALARDEAAWKLQRASDDIRTYYRHSEESPNVHSVRIEGAVEAGTLHVLALLHEVDLYKTWMPSYNFIGLRDARRIDERVPDKSPVELVIQVDVAVPWPVSDRTIFLRCTGVDCMQENCMQENCMQEGVAEEAEIVVLLETPESEILESFRSQETVEAVVLPPSGVLLRPRADGTTFVCVVLNADPQLAIIPDWLVDFAVRNLAFLILVAIRRAAELVREGEEYQSRMADRNNDFYAHLRKRFAETMPQELRHFPESRSEEAETGK